MVKRNERWILAGVMSLLLLGMAACGGDDTDTGDDLYSEDKAILIGNVKETAEKNGDSGTGGVNTASTGQITVSSSLSFDQVDIGAMSKKTLTVLNSGQGNLRLDKFALVEGSEDDLREFQPIGDETLSYFKAFQDGKKIYIAPSSKITLEFEWKPQNTTADTAVLTIDHNDPTKDGVSKVNFSTPVLGPELSAEAKVTFPRVAAGQRNTKITTLLNAGESPLQLKDIVLSPASTTDFKLVYPDPDDETNEAKDSSSWKSTLQPGESIPVRVIFTPDSDAPSNASIFVTSNDPNQSQYEIKLEGNTGTQCIKLGGVAPLEDQSGGETHHMEFGESQIGKATEKTVTIENCSRTQELNVSEILMSDDGGGRYVIVDDSLPMGVNMAEGAIIKPLESATFKVAYTPTAEEVNMGQFVIKNDDEVNAELVVGISGKGTINVCPVPVAEASIVGSSGRPSQAISTIPLKTVEFRASNSTDSDGSVTRYEWNIISKPNDSAARLSPSNTVENPKLFLDIAGEYEIELTVYDNLGAASCETSKVTILAEPDEDIHVQLVWATPTDAIDTDDFGTDLDLHYMRPGGSWDDKAYDVFWQNPTSDWGVVGDPSDDPSLDIDDTDGHGPENINHDNPKSGLSYAVGVYYYNDNGFGASYATIRIYIEGQLKFEVRDKYLQKEDVFWDVATITWPNKMVFKRDRISQGFPR